MPEQYKIALSTLRSTMALADHIEMEHERELAPGTTPEQIRAMHTEMHATRDDWPHTH